MDGWMDGWMEVYACTDVWMYECMHGWVDGRMDGIVDGWMDEWMVDVFIKKCGNSEFGKNAKIIFDNILQENDCILLMVHMLIIPGVSQWWRMKKGHGSMG